MHSLLTDFLGVGFFCVSLSQACSHKANALPLRTSTVPELLKCRFAQRAERTRYRRAWVPCPWFSPLRRLPLVVLSSNTTPVQRSSMRAQWYVTRALRVQPPIPSRPFYTHTAADDFPRLNVHTRPTISPASNLSEVDTSRSRRHTHSPARSRSTPSSSSPPASSPPWAISRNSSPTRPQLQSPRQSALFYGRCTVHCRVLSIILENPAWMDPLLTPIPHSRWVPPPKRRRGRCSAALGTPFVACSTAPRSRQGIDVYPPRNPRIVLPQYAYVCPRKAFSSRELYMYDIDDGPDCLCSCVVVFESSLYRWRKYTQAWAPRPSLTPRVIPSFKPS